ncbi:putative PTS IIA-like nitrogen-regulatory protein PtsN [Candidatus Vecturithrix granuli]|uniref:Putative PTS IIA-like nitrogen-regulatory protein PtsN n=1 Tax=Vecturithrix granuli TaxID=1499967 RepID=A0A081C507_VECG1|nr:putative PTS IIA-like nitrogen-regulatory protein PtsN [Candidatus Vecturithrix granuli]
MDHLASLHIQVFSFGLLILVAHFMGKITYHFNLGELIGQLLGGILVNPYLLKVAHISGEEYTLAFRNFYFFTFVFLSVVAFTLGEELHIQKLKGVGIKGVLICVIQIMTTLSLVTGGFLLLGFDPFIALIIGSIGLATSHAATFVITNKLRIEGELQEILANIIVLDDLLEVIMFSLVVQFAIGSQRGREISFSEATFHAFHEVGLAMVLAIVTFLLLKFIIREIETVKESIPPQQNRKFAFWHIFHEHPSPSMEVMFVVVSLLSISVSIAMKFHLPFILVPIVTGMCISNFHTPVLFDSLKMETIAPFFHLMFFALIGANIRVDAIHTNTIASVLVYIVTRSVGKLIGTRLGTRATKQDLKIQRCLPKLMLPQAGVAAVEATYVAIVLENGDAVLNVILPSLIFFEIVGVILSEKTLHQWKAWTIGEEQYLQRPSTAPSQARPIPDVRLSSVLSSALMKIPLQSTTKEGVIWELLETLKHTGQLNDVNTAFRDIMDREKLMSTGIGDGIAIPHGKTAGMDHVLCAFGLKPEGVDFHSIDGQPADIFFLIVSPEENAALHLKFLSLVSGLLQSEENRQLIRTFSSPQDAMAFFTVTDELRQARTDRDAQQP